MTVGSVVRSISGRDKKRVFMITGVSEDDGRVMIADGELHKIASPKKKNLRHLAVLAIADDVETSIPSDDEKLHEYLKVFEENHADIKS